MIKIVNFASGSKGNFTLIKDDKTSIVIDCGISKNLADLALNSENLNFSGVNFALFTHSHYDHIMGENDFKKEQKFALSKTLTEGEFNVIKPYTFYNFGSFKVEPLKTSHDTLTPCGFKLIHDSGLDIVYLTDTGMIPKRTLKEISNASIYIIESNHDEDMLFSSNRPEILKNRIYGPKGHLSNKDSAIYMTTLVGNRTEAIFLAHLSEECNTPELALDTYYDIFYKYGMSLQDIVIDTFKQREKTEYVKN